MRKLKEELINLFSIVFLVIFFMSCKNNLPKQKNIDNQNGISNKITLTKDVFLNCTGARDTVFANGDYLKFIPLDNDHCSIEIKINNTLDTLDFYLNCKTYSGMIPKVICKSDSGYLGLEQGSSSYGYFTLCSLSKETKKINIKKFETAIDVSSEKEGLLFIKEDNLYFYDRSNKIFYSKKISKNRNNFKLKEFKLGKNRVIIIYEDGDSQTYMLSEFHPATMLGSVPHGSGSIYQV
jgi:hypothetical protein